MSYCKKKGIEPTVYYCLAREYCQTIARIIVTQGSDYVPDGTIPEDNK